MTFEEFNVYQDGLLKQVVGMKDTKGREYAHDKERFANFNRLSKQLDYSNVAIAWIYLSKHLDGIVSYIKDGKIYSDEGIQGRIVDAITYLTLIGGMIKERDTITEKNSIMTYPIKFNVGTQVRLIRSGEAVSRVGKVVFSWIENEERVYKIETNSSMIVVSEEELEGG